MSSSIASKNLYELLGNDPELDPERATPKPPTTAVDKPLPRTGKRNAPPAEVPANEVSSRGGNTRRGANNMNEAAFRDRTAGSEQNRSRGTGAEASGNGYRGRGGRGGRGRGRGNPHIGDRHSRTGVADHEKQLAHGWGGQTGADELADEKAGEAIAKEDEKEDGAIAAEAETPAAEEEPEDKTKSYAAYLAELAEKKLSLAAENVRKANEGSSKKFPEGKALSREEEEEAYIAGSGGKAKRERQRKEKTIVELDDARLHSAPRESLGGRGGRGGRGRGEFRGGEGRGRGGRGRGEGRGRGGRGQAGPNLSDSSAFPSLGA
ncbi:hypothetical protein GQ43DRAFT_130916 [Delitschia confertaspora ATCC 74209]|uniref:Hyaluronan/mRNA-binding protein domain-containing protein n=1 Tax=Delitschia confertaspora ATCC 74209 TaxID=1513339 RepID=A0A9P4JH46_9PLEO|nr:hypothetical protein GQ43DRAFT_130916 [Delitschia confertaspora ATCC 74209]